MSLQSYVHLVGGVQLLSILHPHDLRLANTLDCTAQPRHVALGYRQVGRVLGKTYSYREKKTHTTQPRPER